MKNQLLKSLLIISLIMPATGMAENNSISLGDLFKKITNNNSSTTASNATLGVNGFKSPDEVKQFMLNLGWKMQELTAIDSAAFDDFYTYHFQDKTGGEYASTPSGMYFSKTDNMVLFTSDSQDGNKPKVFEISNQKLVTSPTNFEDFARSRLLGKMKTDSFIKVAYDANEPVTYVLSASDCAFCVKLEKGLDKEKVNHFVIPVNSKRVDTSIKQARKESVAIVCNGEKPWMEKMIKNKPFASLEPCSEKSNSDIARLEISDLLSVFKKSSGFPTTLVKDGDSIHIINGYYAELPKDLKKHIKALSK